MKTFVMMVLLTGFALQSSVAQERDRERGRAETGRDAEEVYRGEDAREQKRGRTERAEGRRDTRSGDAEQRDNRGRRSGGGGTDVEKSGDTDGDVKRRGELGKRDDRRGEARERGEARREDDRRRGEARRGDDRRREEAEPRRGPAGVLGNIYGARRPDIPAGHYPPPGECRVWHPDRPAGHQPPPEPCHSLRGRALGGAFILHGNDAYDADYDWERNEATRRSAPEIIIDILRSRR